MKKRNARFATRWSCRNFSKDIKKFVPENLLFVNFAKIHGHKSNTRSMLKPVELEQNLALFVRRTSCWKISMNTVVDAKEEENRGLKCHKIKLETAETEGMKECLEKDNAKIAQITCENQSNRIPSTKSSNPMLSSRATSSALKQSNLPLIQFQFQFDLPWKIENPNKGLLLKAKIDELIQLYVNNGNIDQV